MPSLFDELCVGEQLSGIPHQRREQHTLLRAQRDLLRASRHPARDRGGAEHFLAALGEGGEAVLRKGGRQVEARSGTFKREGSPRAFNLAALSTAAAT